jgi:hypothetical protein
MKLPALIALGLLLPGAALLAADEAPLVPTQEEIAVRAVATADEEAGTIAVRIAQVAEDAKADKGDKSAVKAARRSLEFTMEDAIRVASGAPDVKVDLDLDNVGLKDALKRIFERAKQEYTLDDDVPNEPKVDVHAKNVRLSTALNLVTEGAGVAWMYEMRDGKGRFRVGKSLPRRSLFVPGAAPFAFSTTVPGQVGANFLQAYTRSTFTCPHCKGKTTMVREQTTTSCPKCKRVMQPGWQFCPADGTKRPAAASDWRYCPLCGKQVDPEKTESFLQPAQGSTQARFYRSAPERYRLELRRQGVTPLVRPLPSRDL